MAKPSPVVPHCLACQRTLDQDSCQWEDCILVGLAQWDESDRRDAQYFRRQKIADLAVTAAHDVIAKHTNGTVEEHDYLDAEVAAHFFRSMQSRINTALNKKDLGL